MTAVQYEPFGAATWRNPHLIYQRLRDERLVSRGFTRRFDSLPFSAS